MTESEHELQVASISVQPGSFRTEATNAGLPAKQIEGYQLAHHVVDLLSKAAGSELGDPTKAAARIIAFVTEPGRKLPLRFVVGDDAFDSLKGFIRSSWMIWKRPRSGTPGQISELSEAYSDISPLPTHTNDPHLRI
ncbi:hypothetical protein B0H10DRAFT_1950452 [Mycena sp. CBHHK59/15]|nr:hypothetical protein B0H10DRAFT_1950452 [Mycena sp. CBHHK59/15]